MENSANSNESGSTPDLFDLYSRFIKEFQIIRDYQNYEDIINTFNNKIKETIFNDLKSVKLIYPSFFAPDFTEDFHQIGDDNNYILQGDDQDIDRLVGIHLDYYKGKDFPRISKRIVSGSGNEYLEKLHYFKISNESFEYHGENNTNPYLIDIKSKQVENGSNDSNKDLPPTWDNAKTTFNNRYNLESKESKENELIDVFRDVIIGHHLFTGKYNVVYVYSRTSQDKGMQNNTSSSIGYGGVFILIDKSIVEEDEKLILNLIRLLSDALSACISHNIIKRKLQFEQIKSAKAAIMVRNVSHNLGSHVLFYLKTKLESVKNALDSGILRELLDSSKNPSYCKFNVNQACEIKDHILNPEKIELPFLVGIGKFIAYLQERQGFIATIATSHIPYFMPVNFKDAIFDELNNDYKALRHINKSAFENGCKNVLLSYIAQSEGLSRNNISIEFRTFDGLNDREYIINENNIDNEGHIFNIEWTQDYNEEAKQDLDKLRRIEISLPGGITGRQAFFSIIENFLRNSAKHSITSNFNSLETSKLIIKIDIAENDEYPDLYKVTISNNLKDAGEVIQLEEKDLKYAMQGKNNQYKNVLSLLKAIDEDYIDQYGNMIENNKGIKEMRISAGWLRNLKGNELTAMPKILNVFADAAKNITYEFYLKRPQYVAIIVRNLLPEHVSLNERLIKYGWKIVVFTEFSSGDNSFLISLFNENDFNEQESKNIFYKIHRYLKLEEETFKTLINNLLSLSNHDITTILGLLEDYLLDYYYQIINQNLQMNNIKPEILINDSKFNKERIPEQLNELVKKVNDVEYNYTEETYKNFILFKEHLDSPKQYGSLKDIDDRTKVPYFIESVSGGLSTDRIIRHDTINMLWYYKLIESAYTGVMIIDERLWAYFSGINENQILPNIDLKEGIKNVRINDKNTLLLKYKNVSVCTIFLKGNVLYIIDAEGNYVSDIEFKNYGNNSGFIHNKSKNSINFHFVSIHQGIIDKVKKVIPKHVILSRSEITSDFLENISNLFKMPENNIYVHSGKSRPSKDDLPLKYSFIPFESIEYAVKDCKLLLTEAFYSAF